MNYDMKLIKELEEMIGKSFRESSNIEESSSYGLTFETDDAGNVKGLSFCLKWLRTIPALLSKFEKLEKLIFTGTQISDISSIKELKSLKTVLLTNNRISELPFELLYLGLPIKWEYKETGEEGVFLKGNLLEKPPIEIVKQGDEAVRLYFKSLDGEKEALNEVKVLLVGDGAAGKTSLMKRLLGENFDQNEPQTHGININTMDINVDEKDIKVHFWDFGGQEIMHATHRFFLSKRSLYILVLDSRKDDKAEYWLNHIKSFGGDSPIMVVLNKIDEHPSFEVNRLFLKNKYPNIKGFYPTACATNKGLNEFKKGLAKELMTVRLLNTIWPKSWFNIKKRLEGMTENFIDYHHYQRICREENIIEDEARETLVNFLNDLGVIIHFKDFQLDDTHVLEPKWLTNGVYKIINSPILLQNKGVLPLRRLKDILKPEESDKTIYYYPPEKYKYIFQVMKKFELCYSMDEELILIPDLLDIGEPYFSFDNTDLLNFRFIYNFLPNSVMPRFIVRMNVDILNDLRWHTGVVLNNKGFDATALVKVDVHEKIINININGPQKRAYLAVILNTLRDINNSYEKLMVDECVPLPGDSENAVPYVHLLRLERRGILEFLPEKSDKDYNVKELLDGVKSEEDRQEDWNYFLKKLQIQTVVQQDIRVDVPKIIIIFKMIKRIAFVVGGIIGFFAGLFALFDSKSFIALVEHIFK